LNGNLANNGLVSIGHSPGVLVVNGNFTQGANGVLLIEVGGPGAFAPGVNFDQLVVNGNASFGGTLQLVQLPSLTSFGVGGNLNPITYTAFSGSFATVQAVGDANFDPQIQFGPTGLVATSVASPGAPEENNGDASKVVSVLADQQTNSTTCGRPADEQPTPPAQTQAQAPGHGVGCRGM